MRIGIVTTYLPGREMGGAQLQAVRMAQELGRRHAVTLFARGRARDAVGLELETVRLVLRHGWGVGPARLAIDGVDALRQIAAARSRLDALVCYQTLSAGWIGALARVTLNLPVMVWIRGRHEYRLDQWNRYRLLTPWILRVADRIAVQCPAIGREMLETFERTGRRQLRERLHDRMTVIPNGVDLPMPAETSSAGQGPLVCVARLVTAKGIDDLLIAMRQLPGQRLVLVGDGPDRPRLEEASRGLNVHFTGAVAPVKVAALLRQASCLVLPSHTEAFPNAILEAMAFGLPVVATRVGGVVDLVVDGQTGLLVPPRSPMALSDALRTMLHDPDLRRRMGMAGRERAEQFAWPKITTRLEVELQRMIAERPALHGAKGRMSGVGSKVPALMEED